MHCFITPVIKFFYRWFKLNKPVISEASRAAKKVFFYALEIKIFRRCNTGDSDDTGKAS